MLLAAVSLFSFSTFAQVPANNTQVPADKHVYVLTAHERLTLGRHIHQPNEWKNESQRHVVQETRRTSTIFQDGVAATTSATPLLEVVRLF